MFDVLVESSKRKSGKRAGRYFVVTTAIYGIALLALGIGTVIGFSPALAEEYNLATLIAPPVPPAQSVPTPAIKLQHVRADAPLDIFTPPKKIVDIPPDLTNVDLRWRPQPPTMGTPGLPPGTGDPNGCIGCKVIKDDGPPPQPPPPTPTPEVKKPEVKPPSTTRVSEGVLQGKAVKRQVPVYTQIAKNTRAAGMVQVVVTISEEGRVIEAQAINGHPMLRQSAVDAARQWIFTPTTLSNVPVKVQGVLSFNFVLQ